MQTKDVRIKGLISIFELLFVVVLAVVSFKIGQLYAIHQLTQDSIEAASK